MSLLAKYTDHATRMTSAALIGALADIRATLPLYRDVDPAIGYAAKLWAEFDAYTVELFKRRNRKGSRDWCHAN